MSKLTKEQISNILKQDIDCGNLTADDLIISLLETFDIKETLKIRSNAIRLRMI